MTDDIDQSQCLPRGVEFVTPERLAKNDMRVSYNDRGQMVEAQATVRNILNYLWEEEIIDDQQHHDGQTFEIWREVYSSAHGKTITLRFGQEAKTTNPKGSAEYIGYSMLIRRLSKADVGALEFTLKPITADYAKFVTKNNKQGYRLLFNKLSACIPSIRERIDFIAKLSEEEKNNLAEENLKIAVAHFRKTT